MSGSKHPPLFTTYLRLCHDDPLREVSWENRTAEIKKADGSIVFRQDAVEFPASWSQSAVDIVASKYFRGQLGTDERETSLRQVITRVVRTISTWGLADGYFSSDGEARNFRHELAHILVHQIAAFNSPVWFNLGVPDTDPQVSACFILSVDDTMDSILEWYKTEGMIFKGGSGSGLNLSKIRSSKEKLSGGGTPSGPVSFMKAADVSAGTIKSGGKTRRAAKLVCLDVDHPDILEFVRCKTDEERKAQTLIAAGYDPGFNVPGGAYDSVFFQNTNHSVRVTDAFMQAAIAGQTWYLAERSDCAYHDIDASALLNEIAGAAWACGDPGLMFHDTTNAWHTCVADGPITAANPCGEYVFLDNTSCNLSSINLLKFLRDDGSFDHETFHHVCRIMTIAMDILVDRASYPTPAIAERTRTYRSLGLGVTNLGALLMSLGVPYDSQIGRDIASSISGAMTAAAWATSADIAARLNAFSGYERNAKTVQAVIKRHAETHNDGRVTTPMIALDMQAIDDYAYVINRIDAGTGVRNAQVSLIAPTGTIAFMMDCDTTGIEPALGLVTYKKLVGGGTMKLVNHAVDRALHTLGYQGAEHAAIEKFIADHGTAVGSGIKDIDLPVFACAIGADPIISPEGHLRMMAAVQARISGAISKSVNVPNSFTVADIRAIYERAWTLGLKSVTIYRDGCKGSQPVTTMTPDRAVDPMTYYGHVKDVKLSGISLSADEITKLVRDGGKPEPFPLDTPVRRRLPDTREAITHKFSIAGHEGYVTVGMYADGRPGELFIVMSKEGSTISGMMDAWATMVSIALQYGVPLTVICRKFSHMRFEPSGFTPNRDIPMARSILDYLARWLERKFLPELASADTANDDPTTYPPVKPIAGFAATASVDPVNGPRLVNTALERAVAIRTADSPPCSECGTITERAGSCYRCPNCGTTTGCS